MLHTQLLAEQRAVGKIKKGQSDMDTHARPFNISILFIHHKFQLQIFEVIMHLSKLLISPLYEIVQCSDCTNVPCHIGFSKGQFGYLVWLIIECLYTLHLFHIASILSMCTSAMVTPYFILLHLCHTLHRLYVLHLLPHSAQLKISAQLTI